MNRRTFLGATAGLAGIPLGFTRAADAPPLAPRPGAWRAYEVVTRVELGAIASPAQAWVPVPMLDEASWVRTLGNGWTGNPARMALVSDATGQARMVRAEWAAGTGNAILEVTSRIATRDRDTDFTRRSSGLRLHPSEFKRYTASTELLPTDGIVRKTAVDATRGARTDVEKARALYEWVVDNTHRDAKTRGCGVGDIKAMLETGSLGGKCADLNALYVGLARACGIPARDVYGLRVAPSAFGYRSLGVANENVTRAQHCRAEVWLAGLGWVPVDPADVRKVVLEEPPGNLQLGDAKVVAARRALFGAWEMNWLPYNTAHDVVLPGSRGAPIGFLMYPQAETATGRLDSLDPDAFRYTITARSLAV